MKNLLLSTGLLCLLLSGISPVLAQGSNLREDPVLGESRSDAIIRQEMHQMAPLNTYINSVALKQAGNSNSAQVALTGQLMELAIGQHGHHNNIDLDVSGYDSRLTLLQKGSFNEMTFSDVTANGATFQAHQYDNFNRLEVDGAQSGNLPTLKIEQSGGARLIVNSPGSFYIK